MEPEVTLMEVLQAREARASRQQALLEEYRLPVVSFTLNIAGPVKNGPVIRRAFREGLARLEDSLRGASLRTVHREEIDRPAGCEALWVVSGGGRAVKALCADIEDRDPLGRLFDLDVLDPRRGKWDRADLGHPPRRCLVCGREGKGCASRRLHTVEALQQATRTILADFFAQKDRAYLAGQAARALLYEVCTTPKPGLVDRANTGSHRDMDVFTFLDSTAALLPYLSQAVAIGQETAQKPPAETFDRLRRAGLEAERAMFQATGGVNTHKGAIFSMGCLCGAAGRLWRPEGPCREPERLLAECGAMAAPSVEAALSALTAERACTAGERLYVKTGLRGVRGEAADGFPAVSRVGLPALRAAVKAGASLEEAGTAALTALMAHTVDTNLIARGGPEGQRWAAEQAGRLCRRGPVPDRAALEALDRAMIGKNLSPGGCADLLAIVYFSYFLSQNGDHAAEAPAFV